LVGAKQFGMTAVELAEKIKELCKIDNITMDISPKGFINFFVTAGKNNVLLDIISNPEFGTKPNNGKKVIIEFVSANPTGPLHIGHARQGVIGDVLANIYKTQGWAVTKEYYYNDAGKQIDTLGESIQSILLGTPWQDHFYNGDYIKDLAAEYSAAGYNPNDIAAIKKFAVDNLKQVQSDDLSKFGIVFDTYTLESSMFPQKVSDVVSTWTNNGYAYTDSGATWFKSTAFGDDKDRVAITGAGNYTYFVPDVAYHLNKAQRCDKAINIQGADHHGTIARVKAGVNACGVNPDWVEYILHKMVTVVKNDEIVKISKRAGHYITLSELIDMTSKDAVRFAMISKTPDTEFTFDVDIAVAKNNENPLYYVQYAHARICSVLEKYTGDISNVNLDLITDPAALDCILYMQKYPGLLEEIVNTNKPHLIINYVKELAAKYHHFYAKVKILTSDDEQTKANIVLVMAVKTLLAKALSLIGVEAPEEM
jgi:arginyl-tRNA synthetase